MRKYIIINYIILYICVYVQNTIESTIESGYHMQNSNRWLMQTVIYRGHDGLQ